LVVGGGWTGDGGEGRGGEEGNDGRVVGRNTAVKTYVVVVVVWVGVWVAGSMIKFKLGWVGGLVVQKRGRIQYQTKTHVARLGELYR